MNPTHQPEDVSGDRRRLRLTGETWLLAAMWALFVVLSLSQLLRESEAPQVSRPLWIALAVPFAVFTIRTLRTEIRIDDDLLLVRGVFRTRRLPWDEVEQAMVEPTNANGLLHLVAVYRTGGNAIRVDGIANLSAWRDLSALPVTQMAAAINARATGLGPESPDDPPTQVPQE